MSVEWLNAAALSGLAAIAGPIVVHLLRRHRAPRLPFPTLRFIKPSRAAAIRMRAPEDLWLLLLRVAIVALAALAWAQPIFFSSLRQFGSNQAITRAIVADTSDSVSAERSREATEAARQGADAFELTGDDLPVLLESAVERLASRPSARREIVVLSDFAIGTLTPAAVARVPAEIGIRFVRIERAATPTDFDGSRAFGAGGVPSSVQKISLDGPRTVVALAPSSEAPQAPRILTTAPQSAVDAMLRAVAAAGTPAPPRDRRIAIAFGGAALPTTLSAPRDPWMLQAIVFAREHEGLREAASVVEPRGRATADALPGMVVARGRNGQPVVSVAASESELLAHVAAEPSDYVAAAATRALLFAVSGRAAWPEREIETIANEQLQQWTRAPQSAVTGTRGAAPPGDARLLWGVVLLLLVVETVVRRRRGAVGQDEEARRAA